VNCTSVEKFRDCTPLNETFWIFVFSTFLNVLQCHCRWSESVWCFCVYFNLALFGSFSWLNHFISFLVSFNNLKELIYCCYISKTLFFLIFDAVLDNCFFSFEWRGSCPLSSSTLGSDFYLNPQVLIIEVDWICRISTDIVVFLLLVMSFRRMNC
jgi:hypothetical protein